MRGRWEVVKKTKRKGRKKEGRGALIHTARTCRRGETIRFVMRGSSVTKRAWDVSGWARMREMRKGEGARCSFRIPHMHCYTHLFVMFWSPNTCTPQIFWINSPAQKHFQCARMHIMFTLSYIDRDTHSQWRRGGSAVSTWFPSLHAHSSFSRRPDRTLCPTGHGFTHAHTLTLLDFNKQEQKSGGLKIHQSSSNKIPLSRKSDHVFSKIENPTVLQRKERVVLKWKLITLYSVQNFVLLKWEK